ncbi:hypothetical protein EV702DRAFT_1206340 [Suillus placidus]|uniref:Uncharacterized protein n=1 Tax=Suillus placidus TaxID=48579 RepID=A0A9P6ZFF7_9AGAM|nr:hypothetical protein EV702DRAFT_1206340 [Suillus placidus]
MRAQFEIRPLDSQLHSSFPEEAVKCSSSALDMLNVLHGEAEDARNALLAPNMHPRDNPFWRSIRVGPNERFSLVLTTDPLVGNMTDRSPVPRLRRCDIGKGDSMRSPCKAKAAAMGGGSPGGGQSSVQGVPAQALLSDLPDPLGRYSSLITQFNLHEATVVAPNIRDGRGDLIHPQEYNTKLATGDVVVVECQLKLWTIAPNRRDTAPSDDKNGSRRYQVMLKSMKLLPDTSITPATFANYWTDVKGKCKATDDVDGSACAKKGFSDYGSDDDEDDAATLKDIHAMQVNDD